MESFYTNKPSMKVKLIFNAGSGLNSQSPVQLMDIIKEMQAWKFVPEAFLIKPDCDLKGAVRDAIAADINMFVVCGGDGTVSSVAKELIGKNATLGIIPTGTQNNVAFSLGIPTDIPAAIALLRNGRRTKVDVGMATCGDTITTFLEVCSVGLFSTLFPSGDDIQHGKLLRIGDFLAALVTTPPADIHLLLNDNKEIHKMGHVLLVSNMPYIIRHYKVGTVTSFKDGLLDILLSSGLSKLNLVGYVLKGSATDTQKDPLFQHFRVSKVDIDTNPAMPIMADGIALGEGKVRIEVQKQALAVMVGRRAPKKEKMQGEVIEK